jgi:hypothetical protein
MKCVDTRNAYRHLVRKPLGQDRKVDGKKIFGLILEKFVVRMGVDRTGSGSYPVAGFGISSVEPWSSATRELVS